METKIYNLDIMRIEAFPYLNNEHLRAQIMVDNTTAHYVTIDKYFKTILYIIEMHLSNSINLSVIDAFAGIGSDTIGFLVRKDDDLNFRYDKIISIEINEERYKMLVNNTNLYLTDIDRANCIELHNTNFINILNSSINTDILYLDPPWGNLKDITINNVSLENYVDIITQQNIVNNLIVIKLPKNYNFNRFNKKLNFTVYEILKNDNTVYLNIMIIIIKGKIGRANGWNFRRIIYN